MPGKPGLAKDDGDGEWWQLDNWSYKSCKAPVRSSPPTNQHPVFFFTGRIPFLTPNQQCQSTEGKRLRYALYIIVVLPALWSDCHSGVIVDEEKIGPSKWHLLVGVRRWIRQENQGGDRLTQKITVKTLRCMYVCRLCYSDLVERRAASFRGIVISRTLQKSRSATCNWKADPALERLGMICWHRNHLRARLYDRSCLFSCQKDIAKVADMFRWEF